MGRTRAAILEAAAGCFAQHGVRKTTMGDIAVAGAIAKATLYNHFRAKDDVLGALVESRVAAFAHDGVELARRDGLAAALVLVAEALASDPALRMVACTEAPLLLPLAVPGDGRGWASARAGVLAVLQAAGRRDDQHGVEVILRWLAAQVLWPAEPGQARFAAGLLDAGLAATGLAATGLEATGLAADRAPAPAGTAVGWPG